MAMAQTTIVFDTHQAFQQLTAAGVPAEQAQAQAHVRLHADTIEQTFVTKADLDNLRTPLQADIANLRTEMQAEFANLRTEMQAEFANLRTEMQAEIANLRTEMQAEIAKASTSTIKWLCSFQLGTAALVVAVIKLL